MIETGSGGGIFVTGTDTGVGKTLVAGAVGALYHQRGLRVGVYKPVESGVPMIAGTPADGAFLKRITECDASLDAIVPWTSSAPVAPAAAEDVAPPECTTLAGHYRHLATAYEMMIVESAGGLLVPLNDRETNRDLAVALGLPVLVVAANRLGALNHTLLTLEALERSALPVVGVVLNQMTADQTPAIDTNAAMLRTHLTVPLVEIALLPQTDPAVITADMLAAWFGDAFDALGL